MAQWRSVEGYEGIYEVSDEGQVRSLDRVVPGRWGATRFKGKIIAYDIGRNGYYRVALNACGVERKHLVSRLVAAAFIPNPKDLPQVNHIDGRRKDDNSVGNLEWADLVGQAQHALATGLRAGGEFCKRGHSMDDCYIQAKTGWRYCRTCRALRAKGLLDVAREDGLVDTCS